MIFRNCVSVRAGLTRLAVVGVTLALAACSDEVTKVDACASKGRLDRTAKLELLDWSGQPAVATYLIDASTLPAGSTQQYALKISNITPLDRAAPLRLEKVTLTETDAEGKPVAQPHFTCQDAAGTPCATAKWPEVMPQNFDPACAGAGAKSALSLEIRYLRPANVERRRLRVELALAGDPEWSQKPRVLELDVLDGTPRLKCQPSSVDFGKIKPGEAAPDQTVTCINTGSATVEVRKVELLSQAMPVVATFEGHTAKVNIAYEGTPKLTVGKGKSFAIQLALGALKTDGKLTATLRVHSSDAANPVAQVQVSANLGPCLKLQPDPLAFGTVELGGPSKPMELQLISCGTEDVAINAVQIDGASSPGFGWTGGGACNPPKSKADPVLKLEPGAVCSVFAQYEPQQVGATAAGKLCVESDAGSTKCVSLSGSSGAAQGLPVPCIQAKTVVTTGSGLVLASGGTVIPQTVIALDAGCATAPSGHVVTKWKWSVQQPSGAFATFKPSATQKAVQLRPDVAGKYLISLQVEDSGGLAAAAPAKFELNVVPDDKLHIELTWDTPGDKDNTDVGKDAGGKVVGSDLDLHLAHPFAKDEPDQQDLDKNGEPDPWAAKCWDNFLLNKAPKWGDSADKVDDPRLDLDDKDGWGPENINLTKPELGVLYAIGVYQYNENGFGPSTPRIRVYLDGAVSPVVDKLGPTMTTGSMWCVGLVQWPTPKGSQALVPCKGADTQGNLLTKGYPPYKAKNYACQ